MIGVGTGKSVSPVFVTIAFGGLTVLAATVSMVLFGRGLNQQGPGVFPLLVGLAGYWMTRAASWRAGIAFAAGCGLLIATTGVIVAQLFGITMPAPTLAMLAGSLVLGLVFGSLGSLLAVVRLRGV